MVLFSVFFKMGITRLRNVWIHVKELQLMMKKRGRECVVTRCWWMFWAMDRDVRWNVNKCIDCLKLGVRVRCTHVDVFFAVYNMDVSPSSPINTFPLSHSFIFHSQTTRAIFTSSFWSSHVIVMLAGGKQERKTTTCLKCVGRHGRYTNKYIFVFWRFQNIFTFYSSYRSIMRVTWSHDSRSSASRAWNVNRFADPSLRVTTNTLLLRPSA